VADATTPPPGPPPPDAAATAPLTAVLPVDDTPRTIHAPVTGADRVFRGVLRGGGIAVFVITGLIAVFLVVRATAAYRRVGWSFFGISQFLPEQNRFGVAAILPGGILIALIALVIAVPIALTAALFISEYAPEVLRRPLIALVDLMAAIPSIVYALWGVFFLQPRIIGFVRWVSDHFGFIPFLKVRGSGGAPATTSAYTASSFIAGFVISLMVIPIVTSICREVYSQAPAGEREAAYALGSSRWGMIRTVVLPYGRGGMIGAVMLGFGRAMGETIAASLILSPVFLINWHVLQAGGNSIPVMIALRYQESTPEMLSALMAAGLVLFAVTLIVNALAGVIVTRSRSGLQTAD
jgi:phosphate transport system permease protein